VSFSHDATGQDSKNANSGHFMSHAPHSYLALLLSHHDHKDSGALAMKTYGHLRNEHSREIAQKVNF
jgi:hypothetical protein